MFEAENGRELLEKLLGHDEASDKLKEWAHIIINRCDSFERNAVSRF